MGRRPAGGLGLLAQGHQDISARVVLLVGAAEDTTGLDDLRWVPMCLAGGGADGELAAATHLQPPGASSSPRAVAD